MTPRAIDLVVDPRGWARLHGRRMVCAVGRTGLTLDKREGDGAGLAGAFRVTEAYRRPDRTLGREAPIRRGFGWRHTADAADYNARVHMELGDRSAEPMWRPDPLYDLLLVTDANMAPMRPGGGSALFIHVWRRPRFPTAGCIAFALSDLRWIVDRLTPRSRIILRRGRPLRA